MSGFSQNDNAHELATEINDLVTQLWIAAEREGPRYDELDLTNQQHAILGLIVSRPGITASGLADTLGVTRGAVSQHLAALERERYIRRRRSELDGRSQLIELDRRGLAYQERLQTFEQFAVSRYVSHLPEEDLSHIVSALQKLKIAFEH